MLHDTHAHLDILLQKMDILSLPDNVLFNPNYSYSCEPVILNRLLENHKFIIQSTVSTHNFLIAHKLFSHNSKVRFLIGSHPEIVNTTFDVKSYLQEQRDLLIRYNFLQLNKTDSLQVVEGKNILGLGECGLDYHYTIDKELVRKQWDLFENQINLACSLKLPLVIHNRGSFNDTLAILQKFPHIAGNFVFHCFSEGIDELEQVLEFGGKIGIGGIVTFKNADKLKQVVQACPLERILVETDLPFLAPMPHRGKICLPEYINLTAYNIGEIKNLTLEETWKHLEQNANNFFKL